MLYPQHVTPTSRPNRGGSFDCSSQVFQFRGCFLSPLVIFLSLGTALKGEAMPDAAAAKEADGRAVSAVVGGPGERSERG